MVKTIQHYYQLLGIKNHDETIVQGITNDSRDCAKHWIFISTCLDPIKANQYERHAQTCGAFVFKKIDDPMVVLSQWINDFYDNPSSSFQVIGITGTNGKTSVSNYLKQALSDLGRRCIRLGSDENEFEDVRVKSHNTTMNIMENLKVFLEAKQQNIDTIIMEVSSHAIAQQRIGFIRFDRIIYTNITPEHLDYHKTFTHYMMTKYKLRYFLKEEGKILINAQQKELYPLTLLCSNVIQYGENLHRDEVICTLKQTFFEYEGQTFTTSLLGFHHVMNLIAVMACLISLGYRLEKMKRIISQIVGCEGRMELIEHLERFFIVDYAHTTSALESLCEWAKLVAQQKVYCVMGCGGERDREKRPEMVKTAVNGCDQVVICEDNSRNEPFSQIVADMQISRFEGVRIIEKRQDAIEEVFRISKKGDIILVAGKGNEQFLVANGIEIPYNDKAFIEQLTN